MPDKRGGRDPTVVATANGVYNGSMEWTPDRLTHLATGYWPAAALVAAVEAGIFDCLDACDPSGETAPADAGDRRTRQAVTHNPGRLSADELGEKLNLNVGPTRSLLDALVAVQLLEKSSAEKSAQEEAFQEPSSRVPTATYPANGPPDSTATVDQTAAGTRVLTPSARCGPVPPEQAAPTYAIAPAVRPLLSRRSPACMLDALRYNVDLFHHWNKLGQLLRTGQSVVPQQAHLGGDGPQTRRFVEGMEAKARAYAPLIAPLVDLHGSARLLDVGAGPGTLSRLLAHGLPNLRVTLFDLPDVIDIARQICATDPAACRLDFCPGDYRAGGLPDGHDAILYAGALHQESVASAEALFGRFAAALPPGGQVIVVDLMLDPGRTSPALGEMRELVGRAAEQHHILGRACLQQHFRRLAAELARRAADDDLACHELSHPGGPSGPHPLGGNHNGCYCPRNKQHGKRGADGYAFDRGSACAAGPRRRL